MDTTTTCTAMTNKDMICTIVTPLIPNSYTYIISLSLLNLKSTFSLQKSTSKITSAIISVTLTLTNQYSKHRTLYKKQVSRHILNYFLKEVDIAFFPHDISNLLVHFTQEWCIYGLHEKTGTTYNLNQLNSPKFNISSFCINQNKIGANEFKKTTYPSILLHNACQKKISLIDIAVLLRENFNININLQDTYGNTPLLICCQNGDQSLGIARWLLKHKDINVNLQSNLCDSPLTWCAWMGNQSLKIAEELLKQSSLNVNLQDVKGCTALATCCKQGDTSLNIAKLLLSHPNINVNLQDKLGWTPLDVLIYFIINQQKNYKYVKLWNFLVDKKGKLNIHKKIYQNLNPSNFVEPKKSYLRAIIKNPPINLN